MTKRAFLATALLIVLVSGDAIAQQAAIAQSPGSVTKSERFYRTELFFGRSIPNGGLVSDSDWETFLAEVVTPLYPDGFTVMAASGQYREASGKIAKEPSFVLIFLYKKRERRDSATKIEKIRNEYKRRFSQESVLRVDSPKTSLVSF